MVIFYMMLGKTVKDLLQSQPVFTLNKKRSAGMDQNTFKLVLNKVIKIVFDIWDKTFKNGPSKICGRQP